MHIRNIDLAKMNEFKDCMNYLAALEVCLSLAEENISLETELLHYGSEYTELEKCFNDLLQLCKGESRDRKPINTSCFNAMVDTIERKWKRCKMKSILMRGIAKRSPLSVVQAHFARVLPNASSFLSGDRSIFELLNGTLKTSAPYNCDVNSELYYSTPYTVASNNFGNQAGARKNGFAGLLSSGQSVSRFSGIFDIVGEVPNRAPITMGNRSKVNKKINPPSKTKELAYPVNPANISYVQKTLKKSIHLNEKSKEDVKSKSTSDSSLDIDFKEYDDPDDSLEFLVPALEDAEESDCIETSELDNGIEMGQNGTYCSCYENKEDGEKRKKFLPKFSLKKLIPHSIFKQKSALKTNLISHDWIESECKSSDHSISPTKNLTSVKNHSSLTNCKTQEGAENLTKASNVKQNTTDSFSLPLKEISEDNEEIATRNEPSSKSLTHSEPVKGILRTNKEKNEGSNCVKGVNGNNSSIDPCCSTTQLQEACHQYGSYDKNQPRTVNVDESDVSTNTPNSTNIIDEKHKNDKFDFDCEGVEVSVSRSSHAKSVKKAKIKELAPMKLQDQIIPEDLSISLASSTNISHRKNLYEKKQGVKNTRSLRRRKHSSRAWYDVSDDEDGLTNSSRTQIQIQQDL